MDAREGGVLIDFPAPVRRCDDCDHAYFGRRGCYCSIFDEFVTEDAAETCLEYTTS